jgi:hypothetical protein
VDQPRGEDKAAEKAPVSTKSDWLSFVTFFIKLRIVLK